MMVVMMAVMMGTSFKLPGKKYWLKPALLLNRVFCIGALSITTYNPSTMEATNQWQYSDFITILPAARGQASLCLQLPFDQEHIFCLVNPDHALVQASQPNNEFIITFKKGKKTDSMRFSSDHRAAIITETMR